MDQVVEERTDFFFFAFFFFRFLVKPDPTHTHPLSSELSCLTHAHTYGPHVPSLRKPKAFGVCVIVVGYTMAAFLFFCFPGLESHPMRDGQRQRHAGMFCDPAFLSCSLWPCFYAHLCVFHLRGSELVTCTSLFSISYLAGSSQLPCCGFTPHDLCESKTEA